MNDFLRSLRGDVFGGITAAVVALPVALAFGVASGLGAAAGMYGAIAAGFFAAVFGGTRSQITGPTAPMTVAMAVIVTGYATNLAEAFTVVTMAGILQVLLGLSRIGRFVAYTPHVVVSGFMSGIGIIVVVIQTMPFLGAEAAMGGAVGAMRQLPGALANANVSALAIAVATLAVAVLWPQRLGRVLPAPLVALIAGTLLGVLWLNDAPVIGAIPSGLPELRLHLPSVGFLLHAVEPALILGLLGAVDSLLISLVADSLTGTRHRPDRELFGQGVGNIAAGLIGGLPGAGSPILTVTNIRAGGRSRVSGALYALLMLALVLGLGRFVEPIPHAALAGILAKIGWDVIDWRLIARIHRIEREHLVVMVITLGLTVFVDLLTAVAIGLIAAGMAHGRQLQGLELDSVVSVPMLDRTFFAGRPQLLSEDPYAARVGLVALRGSFTVASSHKLVGVIGADIKEHEVVVFDFSGATYLDDSAAMVIETLFDVAAKEQTEFIVLGLSATVSHTLHALNILQRVPEGHVVETLDEARELAVELLAPTPEAHESPQERGHPPYGGKGTSPLRP